MNKLQFFGDTAHTPFGKYTIDEIKDASLLRFPDGTCREFSSEAAARYYAQNHWISRLAMCVPQPLLTLFLTPGIWRTGTHDRTYTLYQLSEKYSLCEGIAVCYPHQQKEIQNTIKEVLGISSLTELSNQGRDNLVKVLLKLAL